MLAAHRPAAEYYQIAEVYGDHHPGRLDEEWSGILRQSSEL